MVKKASQVRRRLPPSSSEEASVLLSSVPFRLLFHRRRCNRSLRATLLPAAVVAPSPTLSSPLFPSPSFPSSLFSPSPLFPSSPLPLSLSSPFRAASTPRRRTVETLVLHKHPPTKTRRRRTDSPLSSASSSQTSLSIYRLFRPEFQSFSRRQRTPRGPRPSYLNASSSTVSNLSPKPSSRASTAFPTSPAPGPRSTIAFFRER